MPDTREVKWVVAVSSPFYGMSLYGPFDDVDTANDWVLEKDLGDVDWCSSRPGCTRSSRF